MEGCVPIMKSIMKRNGVSRVTIQGRKGTQRQNSLLKGIYQVGGWQGIEI